MKSIIDFFKDIGKSLASYCTLKYESEYGFKDGHKLYNYEDCYGIIYRKRNRFSLSGKRVKRGN